MWNYDGFGGRVAMAVQLGSLDAFDLKLLELLQSRGDMTRNELAEAVHLSASQCSRRVQRLKETGLIRRIVADVDYQRLGFNVTAHVAVSLAAKGDAFSQPFRDRILQSPHVLECVAVAGVYDLLLKIIVRDANELKAVLNEMRGDEAIASMRSSIVLEEIKTGGALSLR
jgi:Lrp/AsnC family transcriptional regulator, leucine-responsive regulatory protein